MTINGPRLQLSICLVLLAAASAGAAEERLLDAQPFDRIVLNAANGNEVLKVRPLQLPGRRVPNPFPAGRLEVRLVQNLAQPYEVLWSDIARIELFEQILLQEGVRLANEGKFDDAFDFFLRLHDKYPGMPGLKTATSRYLQQNALASFKEGEFDLALAMLSSLYEQQPDFGGLGRAVDTVADQMIQGRLKERDFRAARNVLDVVASQFVGLDLTVVQLWTDRFRKGADDRVREGVQFYRNKQFREAREAALQAQSIWPEHKQAQQLLVLIQRDNPAVIVGVRTSTPLPVRPRLDLLATLRTGYLAAPTLTRITDYSPEGGMYASPIGLVGLDATGRELTIEVLDYPDGSPAAYDAPAAVARWLLHAADPETEDHSPALAAVVGSVQTPEPDILVIGLKRPHVRPEALLRDTPLSECDLPAPMGSYTTKAVDEKTLELHAATAGMAISVVEQRQIDDDDDAIAALVRGDIDVLERVAPWQATALRQNNEVVVGQYRLPTVHVLIPTHAKTILDNREFRRALCYGINRERILSEQIQGGAQLPGYQVVSGPFPAGMSLSDPVRYGYNDGVRPRPYEPRLAALLTALSWTNLQKAEKLAARKAAKAESEGAEEGGAEDEEEEEIEIDPFPTLRLAHSSDPIARSACQAIKLQLKPIGIPIELVELPPEKLIDPEGDFDLRYAELATWEPAVDANRLLGLGGVAGRSSDPMLAALERLDRARNWNDALETLRDVHELAAGDLPVIPLWQTANYYAYRRELNGLPQSTIHLYQTLSDWRKEYRTAGR